MYKLLILWLCVSLQTPPSVSDSPCDALSIESADNVLTISNLKAAHTNLEVYKVRGDGGWAQLFSCADNCGNDIKVNVEAQKKYLIHVKMFDANWNKICEKHINHTASGESDSDAPPSCETVAVSNEGSNLTVAHVKAPHSHVDIYKVRADGGWTKIYDCNDQCNETITAKTTPQYKHIVHIKLFSESWQLVCEKKIEHQME
jgi:hypothetical protein